MANLPRDEDLDGLLARAGVLPKESGPFAPPPCWETLDDLIARAGVLPKASALSAPPPSWETLDDPVAGAGVPPKASGLSAPPAAVVPTTTTNRVWVDGFGWRQPVTGGRGGGTG